MIGFNRDSVISHKCKLSSLKSGLEIESGETFIFIFIKDRTDYANSQSRRNAGK
jgi:hypothetical protein